jgi:hypothetical protein
MARLSQAFAEHGVAGGEHEGGKTAEKEKEVDHRRLGARPAVRLEPEARLLAIKPR